MKFTVGLQNRDELFRGIRGRVGLQVPQRGMGAQDDWYAYLIPVVSSGHGIFGGVMMAPSSLA